MMTQHVVRSAAAAMQPPPPALLNNITSSEKRARDTPKQGKDGGKGRPANAQKVATSGISNNPVDNVVIPASLQHLLKKGLDQKQANKNLRAAFDLDKKAMYQVFQNRCRNCWTGGKGFISHPMSYCRRLGNTCHVECIKCNNGSIHWAEDCPSNKK